MSKDIEAIIHFAGSFVVPESVADPLGYYLNDPVKSQALIERAVRCRAGRFIFSSTAGVYGVPGKIPAPEDADLNPITLYGASKVMERILADNDKPSRFAFCCP